MNLTSCNNHSNFLVVFDSEINSICPVCNTENGEVTTFLGLNDTPVDYIGSVGKYIKVNADENGLEFGTPISSIIETVSRTINLDNSMSTAEIQAAIDAVGKYIPAGVNITFQFADGTYTLANRLNFMGFYGGGIVYVKGNRAEVDADILHTSQQVYLDGSGFNNGIVGVYNNSCMIRFYNLKISIAGTGATDRGIDAWMNFGTVDFWYGYIANAGNSDIGEMLYFATCLSANVFKTYTYRGRYSIYARANTNMYSDANAETGTKPLYGLYAQGACIRKSGLQPSGSTANELITDGGEIN